MKYTFYCNTDLKAVVGDLVLLRAYSNPESIRNNYIFVTFYINVTPFLVSVVNFYIVILTITIKIYKETSNNDCTNVFSSYVLLGRVKSAGVTEITTFEGTLHYSDCIRILLSLF